jgi:hypothetical protein
MNKYPVIGGSICAVVLIVLASLTNVVGYQTVQSSNQKILTTEIDGKELLFQTIVDMANNKEIQRVILGSELTGKRFFDSNMRFSTFTYPVFTKRFLDFAYRFGLFLSKIINKSKIQSIFEQYQLNNQGVRKEISVIIERDVTLKNDLNQFLNLSCDCENENKTVWNFPILCVLLLIPFYFFWFFFVLIGNYHWLIAYLEFAMGIGSSFHCFWAV